MGLFVVPGRADHVKYGVLNPAGTVAQAKPKSRVDSEESRLMFASQINQRLREAGMLLSFALAVYSLQFSTFLIVEVTGDNFNKNFFLLYLIINCNISELNDKSFSQLSQ